MKRGEIVESGKTEQIFLSPRGLYAGADRKRPQDVAGSYAKGLSAALGKTLATQINELL
jgi:ABC-type dipeptide/oligopeptide/nickel transport system ATPase component